MAFKLLSKTHYHQGDDFIFSDLSIGRQCVANCANSIFLIKAHYERCEFQKWSKMTCIVFYMEVIYCT